MDDVEFEWVPAQDFPKTGPDFRSLESSVRGFKVGHSSTANTSKTQPAVKATAQAELRETDADDMMDVSEIEGRIATPGESQPRNVVGLGSKSSRSWKLASTARTSATIKKSNVSWDKKVCDRVHSSSFTLLRCTSFRAAALIAVQMKQKKQRQLNQQNAQEVRQKYKDTVKQREQQKAAALQRKEDNRKKNDAAQGQVLSAAAAKKLMKNKKKHKDIVTC